MKPYTYLIGWSMLGVWYYGVRHSKDCDPSDLWVSYFTSSLEVARVRAENGEPDVVQVRRVFRCASSALQWEERLLKRIGAVKSANWLNKNCAGSKFSFTGKHTPQTLAKISKALTGRVLSDGHKLKIGAAHRGPTGTPRSDEVKAKISMACRGKKKPPLTPEHRAKISTALSTRKRAPMSEATKEKIRMAMLKKREVV